MSAPDIPPIVKEMVVRADPPSAFRAFTDQVHSWWPVRTHSVGGEEGRGLRLNPAGFVETLADGTECTWGSVLAWEPPHRLAMTWHPGQAPDPHTQVEVTFRAVEDGTLVRLVHSGWEALRLPAQAASEKLGDYRAGWDVVLGGFVDACGQVGSTTGPPLQRNS